MDVLDEVAGWGMVPPVLVADAGYGQNADFRDGLDSRGIGYVVAVRSDVTVHPHDDQPLTPAWSGNGRKPQPRYRDKPSSVAALAAGQGRQAFTEVTWREGSRGPMRSHFLVLRVRPGFSEGAQALAGNVLETAMKRHGNAWIIRSGLNLRAADLSPVRETDFLRTWGICRMLRTLRRASAVAVLCLIASTTTAGTAAAAPQADPVQTFRNRGSDGCLDYNRRDGLRNYPCNAGNPYQQWRVHVWLDQTRELKNVATGDCLRYNPLGGELVTAGACDASEEASWFVHRYSNGISFENQYDVSCLYASGGYVDLRGCRGVSPNEIWF